MALSQLRRGGSGGRLLLHEHSRTINEVVPRLIELLLDRGFRFVPLAHYFSPHAKRRYHLYSRYHGHHHHLITVVASNTSQCHNKTPQKNLSIVILLLLLVAVG